MSQDRIITALIGFAVGALFGAALAMLFTPWTGRELQGRIRAEAEQGTAKIRDEYEKGMVGVQRRIEGIRSRGMARV
jgi:gas vesicle protein